MLQAHKETDEKYNETENCLNQRFERGKEEVWGIHKRVVETTNENMDPQTTTSTSSSKPKSTTCGQQSEAKKSSKTKKFTTVEVEIIGGHYTGNTYRLVPKTRYPCFVGRSQGKKFKDRGMSLPRDLEISTTHGKFILEGGLLYYCDAGSTNGSKAGSHDLEPNTPFPLEDGTELTLGQTVMKITLS